MRFAVVFGVLSAIAAAGYSISTSNQPLAPVTAARTQPWSPKAAAGYLDRRVEWWMRWDGAARDHGTFCISCHTALPYALSRGTLGRALGESAPSADEARLLADVTTRVRLGHAAEPYYSDQNSGAYKTPQSRGTESVLNALVLVVRDSRTRALADDTRAALAAMWASQKTDGEDAGAWEWLQFGLKPWEAGDSAYYGAALAALAVATAPPAYRASPSIQLNLRRLRDYLTRNDLRESLANRLVVLWASTGWPDLLDAGRRRAIVDDALDAQRADGGWSLGPLARSWRSSTVRSYVRSWIRRDYTWIGSRSDGYATGLAVLALAEAGVPRDDVRLQKARRWLVANQNAADGSWPGYSLNERRDPASEAAPFMSDAATAFAALALVDTDPR